MLQYGAALRATRKRALVALYFVCLFFSSFVPRSLPVHCLSAMDLMCNTLADCKTCVGLYVVCVGDELEEDDAASTGVANFI